MPSPAGTNPDHRFSPFPLTDVQTAYVTGRTSGYAYGGVGCHGYGELRFPIRTRFRLEDAWNALVERHDMLRAVVQADGTQQVRNDLPRYRIAVHDVPSDSSPPRWRPPARTWTTGSTRPANGRCSTCG